MSEALCELHQSNPTEKIISSNSNTVHRTTNRPFSKIDCVEPDSPADKAVVLFY